MSLAIAIASLLLCAVFAMADSSVNRDTVELPAARAQGQRIETGPANVSRLNENDLRRFASLEEAVQTLPGFRVRQEGGLGGYSELSFRGSDASAVEIYLDGLRLNQEGSETPDLSKWPLLWFSGMEARSGFDVFSAGDPGSLARIDLSTESSESKYGELRGRLGSFSTAEGAATAQGGKTWKWTVGVEGQTADNDYPFFSDNGTFYNTGDDAVLGMRNNGYWSRGACAALRHDGGSVNQKVSALWLDYRKEYPGIPNTVSDPKAYTRRSEWMGAWRIEAYPGKSAIEAGLQAHRFSDSYRDADKSLGYLSYNAARSGLAVEADARARRPLTDWLDAGVDSRVTGESVEPTSTPYDQVVVSPSATRKEGQLGILLQEKATRNFLFTEEWHGSMVYFRSGQVSNFPNPDSLVSESRTMTPFSLRAGVEWRTAVGNLEALGRYEERAPSSQELLGDNSGIRPRLNLNPQKTWAVSFIHDFRKKGVQLQTTAFWHLYEDPIRLEAYGSSSFLRYGNGPAYRAVGIESDGKVDLEHLEARASLTLQQPRILKGLYAGNSPAYQDTVHGHAELFWKSKTILFRKDLAFSAGPIFDLHGPYYPHDLNLPDERRSTQLDLGFHTEARQNRGSLGFDVRNITDHHSQDFAYSVRSGRSYSLTLSINL